VLKLMLDTDTNRTPDTPPIRNYHAT